MEELVGTVAQLTVYPVRSLAGRPVDDALVEASGLAGDRAWVVLDAATGERVTTRSDPGMAGVVPTGDAGADAAMLSRLLGRRVLVVPAPGPPEGAAAVHLVGRAALERAARGEVPEGCSAADPRANLLLESESESESEGGGGADGPGGAGERGWVGRDLAVGTAVLQVTRTPKHCLGVYAEVRRPGRIAVGDAVLLRS